MLFRSKAGISNLLTIHSALSGRSISELENEFSGKGYGDFKSAVAEVVISSFEPVRQRTEQLLADEKLLHAIMAEGQEKARAVAQKTIADAYNALGLVPSK